MVTKENDEATRILGPEFDDSLRERLVDVLRGLGAIPLTQSGKFVVGSQDIEILDVTIDGRALRVQSETYIGLSICGPADLVEIVCQLVTAIRDGGN